jgi:hypothetical protein
MMKLLNSNGAMVVDPAFLLNRLLLHHRLFLRLRLLCHHHLLLPYHNFHQLLQFLQFFHLHLLLHPYLSHRHFQHRYTHQLCRRRRIL